MNASDKADLLRILQTLEDTLLKNWTGYGGLEDLQEKILRLRMILEEEGEVAAIGSGALVAGSGADGHGTAANGLPNGEGSMYSESHRIAPI
jgi:hypothetical protein